MNHALLNISKCWVYSFWPSDSESGLKKGLGLLSKCILGTDDEYLGQVGLASEGSYVLDWEVS